MKSASIILCIFFISGMCKAQSLAINTDGSAANSSALLDIKSTTKGLLIPRLTKTEKYNVTTPAIGLLIYQTGPDSTGFYYYQNSQWNWITDNKKSDTAYWSQYGNANTNPPPNFPFGVYNNYTYLGTPDAKDVSLVAGGNELVRLKQFATGGRIGMSNQNPEYALDIRTTELSVSTAINGMRIIPKQLYDYVSSNNMDKGFIIGNDPVTPTENIIWNHSNNINGVIRIGLDFYNQTIRPAININQYGQGIYQRNPKYALDIHSFSQFAPATISTNKNGVRITYQNQESQNDVERGLFMGVTRNNSFKSYLWNYADGLGGNSPDRAIYFGVGGDMDLSSSMASMELQDGKIMLGHITDPNFFFPSTLNIQTDYAASVAKNGLSVMQHSTNNESAYFGVNAANDLNIYKYGTGDILLGINGTNHVIIKPNGNVGVGTINPLARLHVADSSVLFSGPTFVPITTSYLPPAEGPGTRMMWYPQKAAFRAGTVDALQWDKDNIGIWSFAGGAHTTASGAGSVALGFASNAIGSVAMALGNSNYAIGDASFTTGNSTIAYGYNSAAMGLYTKAKSNNSMVIGIYNDTTTSNRLFEIGNGTADNARTNAMTVLTNGNIGVGIITPLERLHVLGNIRSTTLAGVGTRLAATDPNGVITNIVSGSNGQILSIVAGIPTWSANTSWSTLGNTGTSAATNFLGTTDANDLVIRTNGIEALRITAGGNLGIGTTTPHAQLQFSNTIVNRKLVLYDVANNDHQYYGLGINNSTFRYQVDAIGADHVFFAATSSTNSNELMRIKGNGNVGIGNNNPTRPLSFPATLGEKILLYPGGVGEVGIGVYGNELRLHSDNPGAKVSFGTQDNFGVFTENAKSERNGVYAFSIFGSLWVNGTTYASDERFKQNITSIESPLQKLMQLNGVEYEMRTAEFPKNYFQPGRQIGLLAQNVEKIVPEAVNEKDGYKGVDYARLVPLLIEAIKELQKEVETLKNK